MHFHKDVGLPWKGTDMLHLKFYNAATGEKIYDYLYESFNMAHVNLYTVPQIKQEIAEEYSIELDMIACEAREI